MYYTKKYQSPMGTITMASDGAALTGLWFDGQKYYAATLPQEHEERELPVFTQTEQWLKYYFRGINPPFMPPLAPHGSPFRQAVWKLMSTIPYGTCMTYGELARQLAQKRGLQYVSAQAVGGAVAHNPISILLPCHRVVGSSGSLTGYAGGIDKKLQLLQLERADLTGLFVPKTGTAL